jgi:hypothetical protein
MKPNSGVSPMSTHVCIAACRPRVRNSGLSYISKLLAGGLSEPSITSAFNMSLKPSALHQAQAVYTKASTQSLRV